MLSWAVPMNCRSVAEHVWMTAARLFPPTKRTSAPMAKIATASPAAAVKRGFTPPVSACSRGMLHHPFGWEAGGEPHSRELCAARARATGRARCGRGASKDEAAVGAAPLHADCLVDSNCRRVLRTHEETDRRHLCQQQAAEVTHPALRVALVSRGRIDPYLLHLHRGGRPGRGLGLEEDRAALDPN